MKLKAKEILSLLAILLISIILVISISNFICRLLSNNNNSFLYSQDSSVKEFLEEIPQDERPQIEQDYLKTTYLEDPSNTCIQKLSLIYNDDISDVIMDGTVYNHINNLSYPNASATLNNALYVEKLHSNSTNPEDLHKKHKAQLIVNDILFNMLNYYILINSDQLSDQEIENLKSGFLSTFDFSNSEQTYFESILDRQ